MHTPRNFNKKKCLFIASFITLTSCTTITYKYIPPSSQTGRMCINRCINYRSECRSRCDFTKLQYDTLNTVRDFYGTNPNVPPYELFNNDNIHYNCYTNCDADYRMCYQNCGGLVQVIETPVF